MVGRDASSFNVVKLEQLIRDYVNHEDNSMERLELSNMIIDGEDLIDALDILDFETEKETEENKQIKVDYEEKLEDYQKLEERYEKLQEKYEKLEEDYNKNLKQNIKSLIEGKKGSFIDKINNILEE